MSFMRWTDPNGVTHTISLTAPGTASRPVIHNNNVYHPGSQHNAYTVASNRSGQTIINFPGAKRTPRPTSSGPTVNDGPHAAHAHAAQPPSTDIVESTSHAAATKARREHGDGGIVVVDQVINSPAATTTPSSERQKAEPVQSTSSDSSNTERPQVIPGPKDP